jgi:hypothetical protein
MEVFFNFCLINFLPNHMVEVAEILQPNFAPPYPQIRVKTKSRRLKPDKVDYWEGALQLLFYKLCLKMIGHSSRSTWGTGPSRSRFWVQKFVMPTKSWMFYHFCFVNVLPSCTVEAAVFKKTKYFFLLFFFQCFWYNLCDTTAYSAPPGKRHEQSAVNSLSFLDVYESEITATETSIARMLIILSWKKILSCLFIFAYLKDDGIECLPNKITYTYEMLRLISLLIV